MSKHWNSFQNIAFENVHQGAGSEHEDCYETFENLARKSRYSTFDNSKKVSVQDQILNFLYKNPCTFVFTVHRQQGNDAQRVII